MHLQVKWLLSFKQRAYLNITNLRKAYQQQPMLVWRLYHTLKPGAEILLPPALPPAGSPTNLPWFDYILCIRLSSSATTGLLGNAQSSTAAVLAGKLLCGADIDPATCSLQLIYAGLEEGTYDPTVLSAAGASDLLSRVMLAADYELLTMLVDAGIGECCTQPCLQLLLQYAQLEGLPQMAHVVVQRTNVEVTFQVNIVNKTVRPGVADRPAPALLETSVVLSFEMRFCWGCPQAAVERSGGGLLHGQNLSGSS